MFPKKTKTTRKTVLIRLGGDSIPLDAGENITVYDDDGHYATASVVRDGKEIFGSIPSDAYQR